MKTYTKTTFLKELKKISNYDEIIYLGCMNLTSKWYTAIVRVYDEYRIYRSVCDWISEEDKIKITEKENALQKAIEIVATKL